MFEKLFAIQFLLYFCFGIADKILSHNEKYTISHRPNMEVGSIIYYFLVGLANVLFFWIAYLVVSIFIHDNIALKEIISSILGFLLSMIFLVSKIIECFK